MTSPASDPEQPRGVLLHGYLKKIKRMKKKYFVLYGDIDNCPGRLEYFDSDKKWKHGHTPKRSIILKNCFNINRKAEGKHKWAISVHTNNSCFSIALESEEELVAWLTAMLRIQQRESLKDGEMPRPFYDHVWEVSVKNKELGTVKNIIGPYRLCLISPILKLFKMPITELPEVWEFPLMGIRRCGHTEAVFFMELGRSSVTGAGELWMQAADAAVAQNIHEEIISAMRNCAKEDLAPRFRTRSSSANEQSKPSAPIPRKQNTSSFSSRDRADSVPSRPRTISDGQSDTPPSGARGHLESGRPHSVYSRGVSSSPPATSTLASPSSVAYSNDSAGSSLSIDDYENGHGAFETYRGRYSHCATPDSSLPKESTILEEGAEDYVGMGYDQPDGTSDYLPMHRPNLSSSPSSRSVSLGVNRSASLSCNRGNRPRGTQHVSHGPPPIKPPLYQPPYMEMSSPVASSWSPPNASDGYMIMKPGPNPSQHQATSGTRSGTHTRSSSFSGDVPEGYVPMAPQTPALVSHEEEAGSAAGGYMEMRFRRSLPKDMHGGRGRLSPASSSSLASSVTSGTPSASFGTPVLARFSEYHLDKVSSLLTPSEDDDDLPSRGCRQSRAYSVGSRPESRVKTSKTESSASAAATPSPHCGEVPRVRAFSVGSRMVPIATKPSTKVCTQDTLQENGTPTNGTFINMPSSSATDVESRMKSLSVPVLGTSPVSASWTNPSGILRRLIMSAQSSVPQPSGSDLLEIEYQKEGSSKTSYVSTDSLNSFSVDRYDPKDRMMGSTDSVGRASASSAASGSSRQRTNSRSSSLVNRVPAKSKAEVARSRERKGRHELERLESVPQGRDQDYIEYAQNRNETSKTDDSADEYVELVKPGTSSQSSDYMPMEYGKNSVQRPRLLTDSWQSTGMSDASPYMEMTPSQRNSTSEPDGYMSMEISTPRLSRNSSRQSSISDTVTTFSPPKAPKSGSQSARHSRTEETLDGDCMEMYFQQTERHRSSEKSVRTRGPSPSGKLEIDPAVVAQKTAKHPGFFLNLIGKKPSSASAGLKSPPGSLEQVGSSGTLPRSSRSMPPSPFSSLKRQKKRRDTPATLLPDDERSLRSPEAEAASPLHRRSNSMKASPSFSSRGFGIVPSISLRSPSGAVTPPSPSIEALLMKPSSSQPITIAVQGSATLTPRHSPGMEHLKQAMLLRNSEQDDYVLPQPIPSSFVRYSSSPARTVAVPTLSPLPEGNTATDTQTQHNSSAAATLSPYVNMSFGSRTKNSETPSPSPQNSSSPAKEASPPKGSKKSDDKENSLAVVITSPVEKSQSATTVCEASANVNAVSSAVSTTSSSKPRATSLEKIVGAFDKVKIRHKRHSSGDKPVKRSSAATIYRSNSYQPMGSRGGLTGSKSSGCPPLSEIPAGRVLPINGGEASSKSPPHQAVSASRMSSSSLASLGEEWIVRPDFGGSLQMGGIVFTTASLSPTPLNNSSSPSPSSSNSRPSSVLGEKSIHYAQLDLAPVGSLPSTDDPDDLPRSPRNLRPGSALGFPDLLPTAPLTTYARIDFVKSEELMKNSSTKEHPRA